MAVLCVLLMGAGSVTVLAEGSSGESSTEYQITITPPAGTTGTNTYSLYRIFDATVSADGSAVSYKMPGGKTLPEAGSSGDTSTYTLGNYFEDQNGSIVESRNSNGVSRARIGGDGEHADWLNDAAVAVIARYVKTEWTDKNVSPTYTVTTTAAASSTINVKPGYYYISTTTGTVVAVDTPHKTVSVQDKNTVPSVEKEIQAVKENSNDRGTETGGSFLDGKHSELGRAGEKAIAEVGSTISFQAGITVGKGAHSYVFTDRMDSSLKLVTGSIQVFVDRENGEEESDAQTASDSTFTIDTTAKADSSADVKDGYTFRITFQDDFVKPHGHLWIRYSAVVTSDALQSTPAKNSAVISWGEGNTNHSTPSVTEVYNAKLTVTKTFEGVTGPDYPVAGFVLRKGRGTDSSPYKYYKYTAASGDTPAKTEFVSIGSTSIADAVKAGTITEVRTTAQNNEVVFLGLANADYTLLESTTPAGYNTAKETAITIHGANSNNKSKNQFTTGNLIKKETVNNRKGIVLPSTGGRGTIRYTITGLALIAAAGLGIVLKKRKRDAA